MGSVDGLKALGDGLKQVITEIPDGVGLGLVAEYSLFTPIPANEIAKINLQGTPVWSGLDGSADSLLSFIRVVAPQDSDLWQQITLPSTINSPGYSRISINLSPISDRKPQD